MKWPPRYGVLEKRVRQNPVQMAVPRARVRDDEANAKAAKTHFTSRVDTLVLQGCGSTSPPSGRERVDRDSKGPSDPAGRRRASMGVRARNWAVSRRLLCSACVSDP